jgi:hypothetical protein
MWRGASGSKAPEAPVSPSLSPCLNRSLQGRPSPGRGGNPGHPLHIVEGGVGVDDAFGVRLPLLVSVLEQVLARPPLPRPGFPPRPPPPQVEGGVGVDDAFGVSLPLLVSVLEQVLARPPLPRPGFPPRPPPPQVEGGVGVDDAFGVSLPLLVSVLEQVLARPPPRPCPADGRSSGPGGDAGLEWLWAISLLVANPCPADGRSTGRKPQKRLSAGQRRVPHTPWPSGPFDHRDKEP